MTCVCFVLLEISSTRPRRLILFSVAMWRKMRGWGACNHSHLFCRISIEIMFLRWCSFLSVKGDRRLKGRRLCLVSKRWFSLVAVALLLVFTFERCGNSLSYVSSHHYASLPVASPSLQKLPSWLCWHGFLNRSGGDSSLSGRVFLSMVTTGGLFFLFFSFFVNFGS